MSSTRRYKAGQPVAVYPSSLGGLNYSPASFDPQTGYVYNAASETAVAMQQQTPAQEQKQQLLLGNTFLGLANGDFGTYLTSGWKDYGSISAIDVATGSRVWKFATPQPERGGVTTTAGGVGFAGGGDGVLRAFDVKTGDVLWTFQTGRQIDFRAFDLLGERDQQVAITVGGHHDLVERRHGREPAAGVLARRESRPVARVHDRLQEAGGDARTHARNRDACSPVRDGRRRRHLDAEGPDDQAVGPEHFEHRGRPGPPLAQRQARGRRAGERVNGWVAPATDSSGAFTLSARQHAAREACGDRRERRQRDSRREAVDGRRAEGGARRKWRFQRRLRLHRPEGPASEAAAPS